MSIDELKTVIDALEARIADGDLRFGLLREQFDRRETMIAAQNSEITELKGAESALAAQLREATAGYYEALRRLNAVYASTSWKVAAPLRIVGRWLQGSSFHRFPRAALHWAYRGVRSGFGGARASDARDVLPNAVAGERFVATLEPDGVSVAALKENETLDAIYLIGCLDGESKRYRVFNQIEILRAKGLKAAAVDIACAGDLAELGVSAPRVVIFRGVANAGLERFLRAMDQRDVDLVYDIDDLVFEPRSISHIRAIDDFAPARKAEYLADLVRYRDLLLRCDRVTTSTAFLAGRVETLGKSASVIPNTLNETQIETARRLLVEGGKQPRHSITIGYFSGTATHNHDFAQCEDALIAILRRHAHVGILIVGPLELSDRWRAYENRISRLPFLPYIEMLSALAGVDINIAPLEIGNPYCEGKSQLKIFEAGLLEVPTVASRTASYAEAIEDGVDGFLVTNPGDWERALEHLICSADTRLRSGNRARQRALTQFGPGVLEETLLRGTTSPAEARCRSDVGARKADFEPAAAVTTKPGLVINWLIPDLIIGGGGHRNILRVAYHLNRLGHEICLYFIDTRVTSKRLAAMINEHFYPIDARVAVYDGRMDPADIIFATHWSTVTPALRHRNICSQVCYFVQDFEPMFYPMSSEYILAENTYRLGLYHITTGPWCADLLIKRYGAQAESFMFPIQRNVYFPREKTAKRQNIVFFAKPEMARRCFLLGSTVLGIIHQKRPDIEIITFGSDSVRQSELPFRATCRGLVLDLGELGTLYANADLGLVFSPTNPSFVPYEMMACGLPVVDLDLPGADLNFGGRRDIALLCDPEPSIMAEQILRLFDDAAERERRSAAGLAFVRAFPDDEATARRIESLLLDIPSLGRPDVSQAANVV
jgi:glycosyltransferase involved in cell wall biosynthesis